jgi:hypothetical protein
MRKPPRFLAALALGVASTIIFAPPSRAIQITYIEQAIATGSLGGVNFTNANMVLSMTGDTTNVISMTGDTTNVTDKPTTFFNFASLTVSVEGVGLATFTDSTSAVVNQAALDVGFADQTKGSAILFTSSPSLSTYDLRTDKGPLLGPASYNAGLPFLTTDGLFVLNSIPGSVNFVATTGVPEPAALTLLSVELAGLAGFGLIRRRRGSHP